MYTWERGLSLRSLKAFEKSILRQQRFRSSACDSMKLERQWKAASHPLLMPTPTWPVGMKTSGNCDRTAMQQRRLARRLKTSPTAIGLIPPCFLYRAVSGAPVSQGANQVSA